MDYDDASGRLHIADFLYTEYSIEDVIYQLAKVCFMKNGFLSIFVRQLIVEKRDLFRVDKEMDVMSIYLYHSKY